MADLKSSATLAFLLLSATASVAGTTVECEKTCRYSDPRGRIVFDGACIINFGTTHAGDCDDGGFARYILKFSPKSEAWVYRFFCDDSVEVNGEKGTIRDIKRNGKSFSQIRINSGEIFEFEDVGEENC